ncbi:MAG: trypsin-like peptidase domain-containing protein [Butyribacter sp.]|nr:trypsin-like peptidase domain-containing protein [Butyribacter sp.]
MEENNKKNQTEGYTGEYGNSVDGSYENNEQSTYSYSYKDGNGQSTHSGDYYAGDYKQASAGNNADSTSENSSSSYQYGNAGTQGSYQNSSAGTQSGYQNSSTGTQNGYQNSYQYNNAGQQNTNWSQTPNKKKEKKPLTFGKKIAVTAVCAVLFGLIAGVCFVGVNFVSQKILGTGNDSTVAVGSTSDSSKKATPATASAVATNDVTAITEQCMPAVVAITSTTEGTDYYDLFGQYYQGQDTTSCGSGFIIGQNDKELLIATNNHVIDGAKTISVQFIDGEIYEATEKGSDSSNDLAVIAVKTSKVKKSTMNQIKIADMGDSSDVKVGEMVVAIGNALGYGQSVTVGYVSAKDREITEDSENGNTQNKIKAIQTDAAINPGNSGGALINMQGQVIGINSAKIADSSVEGVGYAIPISVATPIIDELMNREVLDDDEKGYLGISGQTVTDEGSAYNLPYGVYVKEVAEGGAADKAGIKPNDIITAVNKMEVTTIQSLQEKVNSYKKGTKVEITLKRSDNGKYVEKKVTVTLQGSESLDDLSDDTSSDQNSGNSGNNEKGSNNGNGSEENQGNGGTLEDYWNQFFK